MKRFLFLGALLCISTIALAACSREEEPRLQVAPVLANQSAGLSNQASLPALDKETAIKELKERAETSQKIAVARVNGAEIDMFSFIGQVNLMTPRFARPGERPSPEVAEKIKKAALDSLIFEELAAQEAERKGLSVSRSYTDGLLGDLRKKLGTEEAYKQYLKHMGLSEAALRAKLEKGRLVEMLVKREVTAKIKADENSLRGEYEKNRARYIMPEIIVAEGVRFRDDEASRRRAEEVLTVLKANGGDISGLPKSSDYVVNKGNLSQKAYPALYEAVSVMDVGRLTGVIREKDGLHIAKPIHKSPARPLGFEEARKMVEKDFTAREERRLFAEFDKKLRRGARIEINLAEAEKALKQKGNK